MCNGMVESIPNAHWPCTPPTTTTTTSIRPLSLLVVLALLSTGRGSGCVRPYMVQNSWVNLTESNSGSLPAGTVLQYSCDPGYMADGPSTLTCTPLGHWSAEPPRCIQSGLCETPFEPENGGYACHPSPCRRFSHGNRHRVLLRPGLRPQGGLQIRHLPGRPMGRLHGVCMRPFMVQHASTNLSESNRGSFPVGTVLRYSCDSGFLVEGASLITCTPLGHWSSEPPRCIHSDVCLPPYDPENGGHTCHPSPCQSFSHATVIEYFCHEGFILKGDYKYLTCLNGEWDNPMPISCLMDGERDPALPLGMPTLSIVASTASSVALVLLLLVLFVLLQPKLKSFHRREQGVSGQPVSIMVEGVQVTLPSYEEAVNGGGPAAPALGGSDSRVQIVLSEGEQSPEAGPSRPSSHQHSEMAVVHSLPPSFSSSSSSSFPPSPSSSCWALEHRGGAAGAPSSCHNKPATSEEQHSLSLVDSDMDFSDDMPLWKEA
ncbi:hypothetical protein CRUP_013387 [Coryphaenoides rupestris]|nr:hypothetical protein CRUP_013387 [Coryphaenoides rupestris]